MNIPMSKGITFIPTLPLSLSFREMREGACMPKHANGRLKALESIFGGRFSCLLLRN
jgi:hypothetical protein